MSFGHSAGRLNSGLSAMLFFVHRVLMKNESMALAKWMREQSKMGVGAEAIKTWAIEAGFSMERVEGELAGLVAEGCFEPRGALAAVEHGRWRCEGLAACSMWMRFPEIALFSGLAPPEMAEGIIAAAKPGLSASLVAKDGAAPANGRRSESKTFARGCCQDADDLQDRIALLLGVAPSRMEALQATRYANGGFYAPHNDYFPIGHRRWGGPSQRVASVVVYLSEPSEGGHTVIEPLGMRFAPIAGAGLYFAYPDDASKEMTLHASARCAGEKWIATQWILAG